MPIMLLHRFPVIAVSASFIAIATLAPVRALADDTGLETALQVESWCEPFANVLVEPDGRFQMPQSVVSGFCWGAFASIQELGNVTVDSKHRLLGFCPPEDSTRIQLIRIFLKYVQGNPSDLNKRFAFVVWDSLRDAFPCSQ